MPKRRLAWDDGWAFGVDVEVRGENKEHRVSAGREYGTGVRLRLARFQSMASPSLLMLSTAKKICRNALLCRWEMRGGEHTG